MNQLVVATGNKGKLAEIASVLAPFNMNVLPQSQFNVPEADETGLTFVENAIIKARNAAHHTGKAALADDSGLEVDALNGAPGIYSARYAGPNATDPLNVEKLLHAISDLEGHQRSARFQCVMVYLRHENDPTPLICQGTWEGLIATAPEGSNGFGYDPVFWVPDHHCTAAQLSSEVKNSISHRGQALKKLLAAFHDRNA
ncbi:MAG: XTP/dITP diphosphatase [Pseudomonadales bacterium]|nr:XTP/dITP diphosphatase [Pseudomonadales bacterium]